MFRSACVAPSSYQLASAAEHFSDSPHSPQTITEIVRNTRHDGFLSMVFFPLTACDNLPIFLTKALQYEPCPNKPRSISQAVKMEANTRASLYSISRHTYFPHLRFCIFH